MMRWFAFSAFLLSASVAASDIAWKPATQVTDGRGVRGPWQQNESNYDYVDDPSVAIDDAGSMAVVWVDQRGKDVFFQLYSPESKPSGEHINVSRSPATFSWLPRVAFAPGDSTQIYVLWQEIIFSGGSHGGEILFARSEDAGATFSQPVNLSRSVAGDGKGRINRDVWHNGSLDIAAGPDGALYAAWTEYEGALWVVRSRDAGRSFAPPVRIQERRPARAPSLALAPDGAAYLAWSVGEDNEADIRLAKTTDGGKSFAPARIVERSKGYSDAPKIAVDRSGIVHLAYAESTGGPFDRYTVRYTRSSDGGASVEPSRQISNVNAAFPSLALDAKGGVYLVCELFHEDRSRPRGLGYAVSRDSGRTFSRPALVPGSADPPGHWNGSHQGLLMRKLAINARGNVAVVNSSLRDSHASRVWLMRGDPAN
jgi:hypothetical protein